MNELHIGNKSVRSTAKLKVPFLINSVPLSANEELIMEVPEKTKQPITKRDPDWKEAAKKEQRNQVAKKIKKDE